MLSCPINYTHKIPVQNVDKHVQKCCLKSSGYSVNAQFLSEPSSSQSSVSLGSLIFLLVIIFLIINQPLFTDNTKKIEILNAARMTKPMFKAGMLLRIIY